MWGDERLDSSERVSRVPLTTKTPPAKSMHHPSKRHPTSSRGVTSSSLSSLSSASNRPFQKKKNGILLHIQRCRALGLHLRRQGQIRKSASPPKPMRSPPQSNSHASQMRTSSSTAGTKMSGRQHHIKESPLPQVAKDSCPGPGYDTLFLF